MNLQSSKTIEPNPNRKKELSKTIFICLFSVHNKIGLSRPEQKCLMIHILVHDVINFNIKSLITHMQRLYQLKTSLINGK